MVGMHSHYTGTWLEDDGEDGYIEHRVVWVKYKANDAWPEEWILLEVDGEEEHICDPVKWSKAENAFGDTALSYRGD